jgi:chromosome segregation ATPase
MDHLKSKLNRLDSDRRDLFMSGEETKKKNNEILDHLKRENKELKKLRDEALQNKRTATPGLQTQMARTGGFEVVTNEMKQEAYWKKRLDDAKNLTVKKKKQLQALQDKLKEVNEDKFGGPEETPLMRTIRILENRLDKVMIKYNEAQSIRKTYEQIVKRLKEERVGYDNQLAAIERSLKGKERDFEELLLLKHDATHAKELAQAELRKYDQKKAAVKDLREAYLDDKKKAIQNKDEYIQKLERHEMDRGDPNMEPKSHIDLSPDYKGGDFGSGGDNVNKYKLKDYEEAFRRLYEVTGVTDVNDIIQKYTTQDETSKSLNDLKQEYMEKIEYLNNEKNRIRTELNTLKYEGGENMSRKQFDEIESNVNNVSTKCERARLKYERISKILINAKAGIEHLAHKLESHELPGKANVPVTDDTLVEALSQCVERLKVIYQEVQNDHLFQHEDNNRAALRSAPGTTITSNFLQETGSPIALGLYDKGVRPENVHRNIRVRLPDEDDDDITYGESDEDIDMEIHAKLKEKYNQQKNKDAGKTKGKKKEGGLGHAGSKNKF